MTGRPRAALYIDGFNFYYGVRKHFLGAKEERGYSLSGLCWCDFRALAERHFGVDIEFIRYFTAPVTEGVSNPNFPGEHERYHLWRGAVESIDGLTVVEGHYVTRDEAATRPDGVQKAREEKQTDVQIAVEMLLDAVNGARQVDTVLLLTSDQDQWPAACALALPRRSAARGDDAGTRRSFRRGFALSHTPSVRSRHAESAAARPFAPSHLRTLWHPRTPAPWHPRVVRVRLA